MKLSCSSPPRRPFPAGQSLRSIVIVGYELTTRGGQRYTLANNNWFYEMQRTKSYSLLTFLIYLNNITILIQLSVLQQFVTGKGPLRLGKSARFRYNTYNLFGHFWSIQASVFRLNTTRASVALYRYNEKKYLKVCIHVLVAQRLWSWMLVSSILVNRIISPKLMRK